MNDPVWSVNIMVAILMLMTTFYIVWIVNSDG